MNHWLALAVGSAAKSDKFEIKKFRMLIWRLGARLSVPLPCEEGYKLGKKKVINI